MPPTHLTPSIAAPVVLRAPRSKANSNRGGRITTCALHTRRIRSNRAVYQQAAPQEMLKYITAATSCTVSNNRVAHARATIAPMRCHTLWDGSPPGLSSLLYAHRSCSLTLCSFPLRLLSLADCLPLLVTGSLRAEGIAPFGVSMAARAEPLAVIWLGLHKLTRGKGNDARGPPVVLRTMGLRATPERVEPLPSSIAGAGCSTTIADTSRPLMPTPAPPPNALDATLRHGSTRSIV